MAIRYDLGLNNNDLTISNNDVTFVESDTQHIADCINSNAGWWKENPTAGVNIMAYLKSRTNGQDLARVAKIQLTSDGYNCRPTTSIDSNGQLILNPNVTI